MFVQSHRSPRKISEMTGLHLYELRGMIGTYGKFGVGSILE